jgi:NTE family protein
MLHILSVILCLLFATSCCPHKYLPDECPPPLPCACIPEKVKVALVLGSGGVRGMAHVGVLEELEEAGIHFDMIVGCSAGSIVGSLYADYPDASHLKEIVANLRTNSIVDINIFQCRYGLCQGINFRKELDKNLDAKCFEDLQIPLIVVATDLHTGELVPIGGGELVKAVEASCSIPLVFVPMELHGRVLVDGGCINPVPVMVARDLGAEVVIAVDLCELMDNSFPTNLFGVAGRATDIAFLWQNEVCTRNADVIIRPSMCNIGTFNDKEMYQLYEAGKEAAKKAIPRIRELIAGLDYSDYKGYYRIEQLECYDADDAIRFKKFN